MYTQNVCGSSYGSCVDVTHHYLQVRAVVELGAGIAWPLIMITTVLTGQVIYLIMIEAIVLLIS